MQHDEEYLATAGPEVFVEAHADAAEMCRKYHEHMTAKAKSLDDKIQALAIEQTCTICDYSFKGYSSCKCGLRVSADIEHAVLLKHERNIGENMDWKNK